MIDRYSHPALLTLWSDARRFEIWLRVELAACRAMEGRGTVPSGTALRVQAAASGRLDAGRILQIEQRTRHDVIAFLTHVEELAGADARWLHLGMTSSDVLDTSLALQLVEAIDLILVEAERYADALRRRAVEHAATPMIGRSHGIHAEPITMGLVFAGHHAEARRNLRRLRAARHTVAVGKIAGAVGTYAHLDPAVEQEALASLGLRPETVATQVVARDRHAELFDALALVGASIERFAVEVRHLQRTEVGEAEEPFGKGQKGSSAMPHKKNPILAENLTGLSRLLRGYAHAALENVALWHERDISHSSVERVIGPDATTLCHFMLGRAAGLADGLVVRPERMRENLGRTGGLFFSEGVMLALVRTGLPRQIAYEMVQRCALSALSAVAAVAVASDGGGAFQDRLTADPEIAARLSAADIAACFDLGHHLRHARFIVERALAQSADGADGADGGDALGRGSAFMISDDTLRAALAHTLDGTSDLVPGASFVKGKVRDNYLDGDRRILVVTDRISAFDVVLGTIPFKGQVLNQMSAWWFRESAHVAPNHVIAVPDPAVTIAWACEPLPVEFVMRGYLTGVTSTSIWTHYARGSRSFCGHSLPDGLQKNWPMPRAILTPSTKAEKGGHDESLARGELLRRGVIDAATFDEAAGIAARLFAFGQERARERGLILVDTKYELGRALAGPHAGQIIVIDEIHTPDSSRYWYASDHQARVAAGEEPRSLDKEYVRRWYAAQGYTGDGPAPPPPMSDEVRVEAARRYIEAFELITGTTFTGDASAPEPRIRHHLGC